MSSERRNPPLPVSSRTDRVGGLGVERVPPAVAARVSSGMPTASREPTTIAAQPHAKLCGVKLIGGGRTIALPLGRSIVGRSPGAAVSLDDVDVSREHAAIVVGAAAISVEDLSSTNGTFLNGQRISSQSLAPGDCIRFGAVTFEVAFVRLDDDV